MDVNRMLSALRSEREEIERAILFLERHDQLRTGALQVAEHNVIETRRAKPGLSHRRMFAQFAVGHGVL
jgi:hypothetical protein